MQSDGVISMFIIVTFFYAANSKNTAKIAEIFNFFPIVFIG